MQHDTLQDRPNLDEPQCGTCDFFLLSPRNGDGPEQGICRRNPPQIAFALIQKPQAPGAIVKPGQQQQAMNVEFIGQPMFPVVMAGAWCGEWDGEEPQEQTH